MNETLLVIDDNEELRESVVNYLEDREYRVRSAGNGREGLEIVEKESPDLVLTDLRMPGTDGLEVLERARKIAPEMPVIVISGTGNMADSIQALKLGAWDYILKPVEDMAVISHAVEKGLEHARLLKEKKNHQKNLEDTVRERTSELERANAELIRSQGELRESERRLTEINAGLLGLGTDYRTNCMKLTELCGNLLRASSSFYSRYDGGMLNTIGHWRAPEGYPVERQAEGTICFGVIRCEKGVPFVHRHLPRNEAFQGLPAVKQYGWTTYVGHPVQCGGATVGCLCGFFMEDVDPSPDELRVLGILASAIGLEEDRKRAEKTLEDIIEHNPMSIQIVDRNGFTLQVNAAHDKLFGEGIPDRFSVFRDSQMMRQGFGELVPRLLRGEVVHFPDYSYNARERFPERPDRTVWIRMVAFPLRDSSGTPDRFVLMHEDVTQRKQAEVDKEKLQAQLAHAQKMESVGRLAGGVAHDFNNMLGVILGYTEMAMEGVPAGQPLHDSLVEIRNATERSSNLTRQLLAFARKQAVEPRVLDLNETVEGMLKMLRRLLGEPVSLEWCPGSDVGPIKMDPSQIDQILVNLCVNARDAFEDRGTISIRTAPVELDAAACVGREEAAAGPYARLSVTDNGCGMDEETVSHIFEPFFTTKGVGEGTGLGLATVHGVVRQNKGFIEVHSQPGQGTTFDIYLPRHDPQSEPASQAQEEKPVVTGHATILLVDDEPSILNMVKNLLVRQGYQVLAATRPQEAIGLFMSHPDSIDLVMTDVVMPEMNGRELVHELSRRQPALKSLFMSGHADDVLARQGMLEAGAPFIQKPFTMKGITLKLREVLGDRKNRGTDDQRRAGA